MLNKIEIFNLYARTPIFEMDKFKKLESFEKWTILKRWIIFGKRIIIETINYSKRLITIIDP